MEWIKETLPTGSVGSQLLNGLFFPAALLILGGIAANILFPRWQAKYTSQKAAEERRLSVAEDLLAHLSVYIVNWQRLTDVANHEVKLREMLQDTQDTAQCDEIEARIGALVDKKMEHVAARGGAREALLNSIARYRLYCGKEALDLLSDFIDWDQEQSTKYAHEVPSSEEWRQWERRILEAVSQAH